MLVQEQIVDFIKNSGPTLPARVAKVIKESLLITSAHMADLVSQGKVKISNLKIGASPLYYLQGQEEQLEKFAEGNMNPKDLEILRNLKDKKVLRENDLDLLPRVALRSLKDFAIPLQVRFNNNLEVFWKWHLIQDQEVHNLIQNILYPQAQKVEEPKQEVKEIVNDNVSNANGIDKNQNDIPIAEVTNHANPEVNNSNNKSEQRIQGKTENLPTIAETKEIIEVQEPQPMSENVTQEVIIDKPKQDKTKQKKLEVKEDKEKPVKEKIETKAKEVVEKPKDEKKEIRQEKEIKQDQDESNKFQLAVKDNFAGNVVDFLYNLDISVHSHDSVRKNSEHNFVVKVPSVVGETSYYCKAKSKAKCDEKDISVAYMEAQIKKLPLLFLYTKEITKKAQEMLETEAFNNVLTKKIE